MNMNMDINLVRNLITVAAFVAFLAIVLWSYAPSRKQALQRHGESILEDGE